jgi:hypothetical protein
MDFAKKILSAAALPAGARISAAAAEIGGHQRLF